MKRKLLALLLASVMVLSLVACGQKETPDTPETPDDQEEVKDYSGYTIRIYSNSNSTERTTWLIQEAKDAGFTISIDDNSVISGDTAAIQAANENKDGGTTNANINSAMLYAFVDPSSPAGGISTEGWETLWKYCAEGKYSSDDTYKYGFDPLNKGDVAVSTFYSSSLYGKIDAAAESSEHPLKGAMTPENWDLVEIDDGTYYIAEYIGILDKAGRTEEETEAVKAFAEWFGSAETQAAWGEEFDSYPCNTAAADILYPDGIPAIYTLKNFALTKVDGTDMTYAEYVAEHSSEWTNIMTNLGFYWADASAAVAEPDWANLDWATLTQKAA